MFVFLRLSVSVEFVRPVWLCFRDLDSIKCCLLEWITFGIDEEQTGEICFILHVSKLFMSFPCCREMLQLFKMGLKGSNLLWLVLVFVRQDKESQTKQLNSDLVWVVYDWKKVTSRFLWLRWFQISGLMPSLGNKQPFNPHSWTSVDFK